MLKKIISFLIAFTIPMLLVVSVFTVSGAITIIPSDVGPELPEDADSTTYTVAANIVGSLKWIGYAVAIGMLIYVGIKYVMSSADEKASMKGLLVKVVIGCLIIVLSTTIVDMVIGMANDS